MLTELRGIIDDSLARSAWSDALLLGWMAEGQDKFCEDTGFIVDLRSHKITLTENISIYDVPERVIEVFDIYNGTQKLHRLPNNRVFVNTPMTDTPPVGPPQCWRPDIETGSIIIYPAPNAVFDGVELGLHVQRYSFVPLDAAAPETYPEIPTRFHRACVEWAAFKALNNHDAEAQDPIKAAEHLGFYRTYVKDGKRAFNRLHGQTIDAEPSLAYRT